MALPEYEIHALRYATVPRKRGECFIFTDDHDAGLTMDYFVWLIRGGGRTILVDTGFNAAEAERRKRHLIRCPITALSDLGVKAEDVDDVVITHLHYDHAGNLDRLPRATFHIQDREMSFATGRCMCHGPMRMAYTVDDVVRLVREVYAGRVEFHDGDDTLAPGVELIHVGGHTAGLQSVRVHTARGWVVLASDAAHYWANALLGSPFPLVHDVEKMLEGHRRLQRIAGDVDHFIPGHDPLVRERFPAVDAAGDTVALHRPPVTAMPD